MQRRKKIHFSLVDSRILRKTRRRLLSPVRRKLVKDAMESVRHTRKSGTTFISNYKESQVI